MAERDIDLQVYRGHRAEENGRLRARVDPDDSAALRKILRGWLEASSWGTSTYGDFSIVALSSRRQEVRL